MSMSMQEIFDRVATHLLTQNRRSVGVQRDANGGPAIKCLYRGVDGDMCAVGKLIPNELYHCGLEGLTVADNKLQHTLVKAGVLDRVEQRPLMREDNSKLDLLMTLQGLHDRFYEELWPQRLAAIAHRFNLRMVPHRADQCSTPLRYAEEMAEQLAAMDRRKAAKEAEQAQFNDFMANLAKLANEPHLALPTAAPATEGATQ